MLFVVVVGLELYESEALLLKTRVGGYDWGCRNHRLVPITEEVVYGIDDGGAKSNILYGAFTLIEEQESIFIGRAFGVSNRIVDFGTTLWGGHYFVITTLGSCVEICLYVFYCNTLAHSENVGVLGGFTLYYGYIGLDDYRVARSQNLRCGSTTARDGLTNDSVCGYCVEDIAKVLALVNC